MNKIELVELINQHQDDKVELGNSTSDCVPSLIRIEETEKLLQIKLPQSYLWFLSQYGCGYIYGDILMGINPEFDFEDMDDIASVTLRKRKSNFLAKTDIALLRTDYGEDFVFDTLQQDSAGEFVIVRIVGGTRKIVAKNFLEFMIKFIRDGEF